MAGYCEHHPQNYVTSKGNQPCPDCMADFASRCHPDDMTGMERAEEMEVLKDSRLWVTFDTLHQRIELLVGRPVWTGEMGRDWDALTTEARDRQKCYDGNYEQAAAKILAKEPENTIVFDAATDEVGSPQGNSPASFEDFIDTLDFNKP